jgi:O-antigen/teichoic acid export membrane protein
MAGLGLGPGLTLGIARAAARSDRQEAARLFLVALLMMVAIATLLLGGAVVLGVSGVLDRLVTDGLGAVPDQTSLALGCMVLLITAQLIVAVPEAAQLGLQNQHVTNLWAGIGSAAAIVAMVGLGSRVTSVAAFVIVSQGPQIAARAANGIWFVLRRGFLLRPSELQFRAHARPILTSGVAFVGFQVASYVGFNVGLLIMAAKVDADAVALGGVIVRGLLLQVAGLALLTTPTWPAIANAVARGERMWVRRAYRLLAMGGAGYSLLVALTILVAFEPLIGIWTGDRPADNPALRWLLATYVVVNGWAHVNAMTLVGLGAVRFTAIVLMAEAALVVALQAILVPSMGLMGYVSALTAGAVLVSGWTLGLRVQRELGKESL